MCAPRSRAGAEITLVDVVVVAGCEPIVLRAVITLVRSPDPKAVMALDMARTSCLARSAVPTWSSTSAKRAVAKVKDLTDGYGADV